MKNKVFLLIIIALCTSCATTVRFAEYGEKADVKTSSMAAFFVVNEQIISTEKELDEHIETANYLYAKYGGATEAFLISRTNAQTFIFKSGKKSWFFDVKKLKKPAAMILFNGKRKPFIEYRADRYESMIENKIENK